MLREVLKRLTPQDYRDKVEISEEVRRLLENPILREFFSSTEVALFEEWQKTKPEQIDERERIYMTLELMRRFWNYFQHFVVDGSMAKNTLRNLIHSPNV